VKITEMDRGFENQMVQSYIVQNRPAAHHQLMGHCNGLGHAGLMNESISELSMTGGGSNSSTDDADGLLEEYSELDVHLNMLGGRKYLVLSPGGGSDSSTDDADGLLEEYSELDVHLNTLGGRKYFFFSTIYQTINI
jgi:hypothetical protein